MRAASPGGSRARRPGERCHPWPLVAPVRLTSGPHAGAGAVAGCAGCRRRSGYGEQCPRRRARPAGRDGHDAAAGRREAGGGRWEGVADQRSAWLNGRWGRWPPARDGTAARCGAGACRCTGMPDGYLSAGESVMGTAGPERRGGGAGRRVPVPHSSDPAASGGRRITGVTVSRQTRGDSPLGRSAVRTSSPRRRACTSDSRKRRCPPGVRMLLIRPAAAQRVTVFGSTRKRAATSPGVSRRSLLLSTISPPRIPRPAAGGQVTSVPSGA